MELLIIWVLCGVLSAVIAGHKGRSPVAWLVIGCLIGVLGPIVVALLPRVEDEGPRPTARPGMRPMSGESATAGAAAPREPLRAPPREPRQEEHEGASTLVKIIAVAVALALLAMAAYAVLPQL
jgi:hypothetical protein